MTIETGTELLRAEVDGRVAVLTFDRPDRRNALHPEMYEGFARVLPEIAEDPAIGCLVVTGAGGAFCAGGDVKGMNERNRSGSPMPVEARISDLRRRQSQVSAALYELPKVTIAAIPGAAAGAGLSIALACDLRIAAESAVFTTAFAKVGFSGDFGGSWYLTQLLGPAKAKELYLSAERFDAKEAERLGVVNRVAADAVFEQEWRAWAAELAAGPTVAQRYILENIDRAVGSDLRTCLDAEAVAMTRAGATDDHKEAVAAFLEKRQPTFRGS